MNIVQIEDTLEQINELRRALTLSQRAVPFVEEMLKEVTPLLEEIHRSIEESAHKIPRAATQIQSVTRATEVAATEIMDLVDGVAVRLTEVRSCIEQQTRCEDALIESHERMFDLLRERLEGHNDALLGEVGAIWGEARLVYQMRSALGPAIASGLEDVRQKANQIMVSLQVQDITSQQLASVNHLIESIRSRMALLVQRLNKGIAETLDETRPQAPEARLPFDSNAAYDRSGRRQSDADAIIHGLTAGSRSFAPEATTQNDIDALFDAPATGGDGSSTPALPKPGADSASQDDIDALFRTGS